MLPYTASRLGLDAEELVAENDLRRLEARLRADPRIRCFANRNDFLTTRADRRWLRATLGPERVRFFRRGGHLGNLHEPDVQRAIMDSIRDLLPGSASRPSGSAGG